MFNYLNLEKMKKKLFIVLLGLILGAGFAYPSCAYVLGCGFTITGPCRSYFSSGCEYGEWLDEMTAVYCAANEQDV
ncbi:hypothetical protein FACS1894207_2230 [Bacteroidia bacterium]|nr:hypothetical protein FACS1894207_2230 [Bacteroidia bacterium]